MAHYLTNNEKFHIFSKSPVLSSMAVSQAVNKSGHTVSTNDVWADDVPWFTEVADEPGAITRAADARYNDLILWGSDIYVRKGDKTNGASTGTTFAELWEKHTDLTEARAYALGEVTKQTPTNIVTKTVELKNASDKVVLKYHVGKQIDLLTTANNANVASTWAARMFIEGKVVDQFVSPTDKVFAGNPSTGYTTLVYTATAAGNKYGFVAEGEADDDFVNNAFAGIVQFNKSRNDTHKFAASVFEYVGDKLDSTVAKLSAAVFGSGGGSPDEQPTDLVTQVNLNTAAIATLNGAANVDGSVLHTVQVAINGLDNAVDHQGGAGISVVQTNGVVNATVTTATVDTDGTITNGSNVVTATDAKTIADTAATAAITDALKDTDNSAITKKIETEIAEATLEGEISDNDTSTKLVTAEQVVTYVSENAKVTLTADIATDKTGITISPNAQESTSFTIGIDQTVIATKDYVDDAIDALSADGGVIKTLTNTVNTAQQNAAASEAAAKAAQVAAEAAQAAAEAAEGEAASSKTAAESASAQATQSATSSSESAAAAAASEKAAEDSAAEAASSATAAAASQASAAQAAADAASAKTAVEGFEATLNTASLNKTDTLEGMFTITTEGTVKGGFTKFEIADIGLGAAIDDAKSSAVSEALDTNITSVTGKDNETSPKVTVQLSGTVQTPSLTVITSDIASAASLKTLTETVNTHIENAAGLYLSVEKVETLPETGMETNKIYLVPVDTEEGREKNIHTEYIWTGTTWEIIGTTAIDINSLEEAISGVSQVVADTQLQLTDFVGATYVNDKKTIEDSIKAISDKVGETDVAAQITGAIDALGIGTGEVEAGNDYTVTGDAVYTAVNAATTAANNAKTSADKKLASIGNGGDTRVIIGTPTANGDTKSVTIELATTVATTTDGSAYSKTETDDAIKVAKDAADSKIATVEVATDAATHLGAHHISATTDADKNVTIAVSCSDEWEYTGDALTGVTSVINGKMSDGSDGKTIDDANLTSAEGMFQNNATLTTYVGSLGKLTNGKNMFNGCESLTTFVADLTSLTDGTGMFAGCDLTEESLMYIVDSLPVVGEQKTITVDVAESVTNKEVYKAEALTKGWNLV